jgi:serralysin
MLKQLNTIDPFADSALAEHYAEAFEDNDRPGYVNLGDPANHDAVILWETSDAFINGQGGDDNITMIGNTNNTVHGGSGNDQIHGGSGNDTLYGDSGNDTLWGGAGDDHLFGGSGNDVLAGDAGNDVLDGGTGDDQLDGGAGNDVLVGGLGHDILTGGAGSDTFVFQSTSESPAGNPDFITDFERGQDHIDLTAIHGIISIIDQSDGQHVHVDMRGGLDLDILVHTTDGSHLTANDFLLH